MNRTWNERRHHRDRKISARWNAIKDQCSTTDYCIDWWRTNFIVGKLSKISPLRNYSELGWYLGRKRRADEKRALQEVQACLDSMYEG